MAPTQPSQNQYVQQVLENMPPVVTCSHSDSDSDENEMEGLTPAQAKVLQAQQRRLWRAKKEAELNDAVHKAQTAIDQAKEQDAKSHTTTITVKTTAAEWHIINNIIYILSFSSCVCVYFVVYIFSETILFVFCSSKLEY